jgi:hypothetical protein
MFADGLRHAYALPLMGIRAAIRYWPLDRAIYRQAHRLLSVIDMKLAVVQQPMQTN